MNDAETGTIERLGGDATDATRRVVPSTESQREIWLGDRLGSDASASFNLSKLLRLSGPLDQGALQVALDGLVSRHDALRAGFSNDGESMFVLAGLPAPLHVIDMGALASDERLAAAMDHLRCCIEQPFRLESAGLFRFHLVRLAADDHLLLLCAHHIVCDGWSWGVLVRELGQLYSLATGAATARLPDPESFADYAAREAAAGRTTRQDEVEAYWLSRYPGVPPVLDLPCDRPRGQQRSFASARVEHVLDASLVEGLRQLGARQHAGLFAVLLGGYTLLLSRLTGDRSVVVGVPAAGQSADDREGLVGNCVNLLPVRLEVDGSQAFSGLLESAQSQLLDALEHQGYTFGSLLRRLQIVRDSGRMPLVSAVLNLEDSADAEGAQFGALAFEVLALPRRHDAFELFLNAVRLRGGRIRLECQYNADFFDGATVSGWLSALEALLRAALADTATPVSRLPLVTDEALAALRALQPLPTALDDDMRMHEGFERQCDRHPQRIAICHDGEAVTYAGLEARANAVAHRLRAAGIGAGDRVGLALERNPDMLAGLLGVLKAGAAYVPLDPGFPEQRLAFMVEDAGLGVLLTCRSLLARFALPGGPVLCVDDDAQAAAPTHRIGRDIRSATPDACAYVIYTSGSTGQPKGVCVPHRAVSNFLHAMVGELGIGPDDRLVAVTTLSFDIAVLELLVPGCVGAQVILAGRETAGDGAALARLLANSGATMMQGTPSTWRLLMDAGWQPSPGFAMLCGGEPLPPTLAARLLQRGGGCLFNLYGPTETTVWSTCARIQAADTGDLPHIDIGRPIANTQVWVLDRDGNLLPPGAPGEVCIGGAGVTLGYHQRAGLTAERFIPDVFSDAPTAGSTVYRTGDRGRWRADGRLEHLGRLDHQVKLRGFRIELGEIEALALAAPGVEQALAVVREFAQGDLRLVLYVAGAEGCGGEDLLAELRSNLPDYMMPQHVVTLDALPLLPNGKLDRRALPDPQAGAAAAAQPPRTATERAITEAMAQVLGVAAIGIHDDFFARGGHSLLAAQLTARLNRSLRADLPWRALFDARTPARLAEMADAHGGRSSDGDAAIPARGDQRVAPLTPAQERLRQLEELQPGRGNFCLPSAHRLKGSLDRSALDRAFARVVQRQAVLRTVIPLEGPPVQRVGENELATRIEPTVDLSGLSPELRESRLHATLQEAAAQALDIAAQPPFRALLIRLSDEDQVLFFMAHHVLWDGWSTHLLVDELGLAYQSEVDGLEPALPAVPVSFGDYAQHHLTWLQGPEYARQRDYWQGQLAMAQDAPALSRDKPLSAGTTGRSGMRPVVLGDACTDALRALALSHDATLFMALLSVWYTVLHARAGQGDLVVGSPVRGRNHADLEHLMGFFTSLLPLRAQVRDELSFSQLLRQTRSTVLDGFSHPDILLEDLLPAAGRRNATPPPLYHALMSYQDARGRNRHWAGLVRERIPMHPATTSEDLGVWFVEHDEGLWGQLIFNQDAFDAATADELRDRFLAVARAATADPSATIGELSGGRKARPRAGLAQPAPVGPGALTCQGRVLAGLFADVLGVDDVGHDDNFFALGGNSLLALHLIRRVQEATGVRLNLVRLATGTVGSLAKDLPVPVPVTPAAPKGSGWRALFARRRE